MLSNTKGIVIKYSLIFINIFITVLSIFICYSFIQSKCYEASIIDFMIVIAITSIIFFLFVSTKMIKYFFLFIEYISLQAQLNELQKNIIKTQSMNKEFNDYMNNINNEDKK